MERQDLYPAGARETIDQLPAAYSNQDGFLIHADAHTASDFEDLQKTLLSKVQSDWPPSWNAVVDQYCLLDIVQEWSNIELLIGVSKDTPLLPLLDLIAVFSAIDRHHKHLTVRLSAWTDSK